MSNKTSDKNVGSIEDIRDLLLFLKSHGWIPNISRTINVTNVILAIDNVLQEREQDKNRIKELEKELEKANRQLDLDYVDDNYIPKQKVKDKIEELKKEYYEILSEYGNLDTDIVINVPNKNVRKYIDELVIKILVLQELLKGESK